MSPPLRDYIFYLRDLLAGRRSGGEASMAAERARDLSPYLDMGRPLRILDVANGRLRPQYTILRAAGHQVYGVDLINRPERSNVNLAYALARALYTWRLGASQRYADSDALLCSDVGALPFPDNYFDLAISAAAFEHFLNVPAVLAELHRVLCPGGMLWVSIYLFPSPSGGHNVSFSIDPLNALPAGIEPWDHLRKRQLPFSVPLNEWRRDEYLAAFGRHFEILDHYCQAREGEALLTPEIESELSGYTRDELTTGAYAIMARKSV